MIIKLSYYDGLGTQAMKASGLFGKMYMAVDVVTAEAMVTDTAGAIAKFQIGIIRVGSAADAAFMTITCFFCSSGLTFNLTGGLLEFNGSSHVRSAAAGSVEGCKQVIPAKYKIVYNCCQRQQGN